MSAAEETNMASAKETDRLLEDNPARNETLIFNVGGVVFETYRSTLMRMQSGPLTDNQFLEANHRLDKNDFFFDRDPDAFKILLNYLRTGQVSIPAHIDGLVIRNELMFWGLTPDLEVMPRTVAGPSTGLQVSTSTPIQNGTGNKIWNILSNPETSILAKIYAGISYFIMIVSVFILVAESTEMFQKASAGISSSSNVYKSTESENPDVFIEVDIVSIVCCLFFIAEFILRTIFSPNKKQFIFSFLGVIDFLAILPNCLLIFLDFIVADFAGSLRVLRILRLFRILRLLRIFKHFKEMFGTDVIVGTLKSSFGQIVGLFFFTSILVLLWGTLAYYIDFFDARMRFENIPVGCWWAIVTMTTVGYGDIVPETIQGAILASFCAISGLLIIGVLVAVIVTNMAESTRKIQNTARKTIILKG